jgi:hypothetical protein
MPSALVLADTQNTGAYDLAGAFEAREKAAFVGALYECGVAVRRGIQRLGYVVVRELGRPERQAHRR